MCHQLQALVYAAAEIKAKTCLFCDDDQEPTDSHLICQMLQHVSAIVSSGFHLYLYT